MTILKVEDFGGIIPALDDKRLPVNCATEAINCDLRGGGIKPLYDFLLKRDSRVAKTVRNRSVAQIPTACYALSGITGGGGGASAEVAFVPPWGNYTIASGDELWYAVMLPASNADTVAGGIFLRYTVGSLYFGTVDQNGVNIQGGDITPYATGKWYLRKASLSADVGKTIDLLKFIVPAASGSLRTAAAFYGLAWIRNGSTDKATLFDLDQQLDIEANPGQYCVRAEYTTIDQDDWAMLAQPHNIFTLAETYGDGIEAAASFAFAQFDGYQRQKVIITTPWPKRASVPVSTGFSNRDQFAPEAATTAWSFGENFGRAGNGPAKFTPTYGWISVVRPTAALPAPTVVGGAAADVTRSYVITNVGETGLESGPSPPVTHTGKPDGSWNFTSIATWNGTDNFSKDGALLQRATRRIYRTPEGSSTYRYVGVLDYDDTAFNDAVADASLGEELATADYQDMPTVTFIATWVNGMIGALYNGNQAIFCEPFQYHAWPLANRYTIPSQGVACSAFGDKFYILTNDKPIVFTGQSPAALVSTKMNAGEACRTSTGVVNSDIGIIYPGATGWGIISDSGYSQLTREFLTEEQYDAVISNKTVAMFDGRKLYWINSGATVGYALEVGAREKSLTKFEVTAPISAMNYYAPRRTRWVVYEGSTNHQIGKLFAHATDRLKWTWKSKLLHTERPVALAVAQIESTEWDTLSANMKAREAALLTVPPGTPYSITITGLVQAEAWCYLKVWAEADKGADKVLVYDDFVVNDRPVVLNDAVMSDCWQFELRGNIAVTSIALAETERELNAE